MSTEHRTIQLDADNRNVSTTSPTCCRCGRHIASRTYRTVHLIAGGAQVLHPEDEQLYTPDEGDMGWHPIGNGCARKLGMEYSVAVVELFP